MSEQRAEKASARYDELYASGDFIQARVEISKAIAQQEDVPDYWEKLARVQLALGRYLDAYNSFSRVVELDKNNSEAIQSMAELSYSGGSFDEAEKFADQILEDKPTSLRMLLVKGSIALARHQLDDARAVADKMLTIDPVNEGGTILRARQLDAAGQRDKAIATLTLSIADNGDTPSKRQVLLDLYLAAGDFPNVSRTYARLFAMNPADTEYRLDYAKLLYEHGRPDRALDLLARLVRRHPGDTALRQQIVDIWTDVGSEAVNVDLVRRFVTRGGDDQMKAAFAQLLIEQNRHAEAEAILRPMIDTGEVSSERVDADVLYAGALAGIGRGGQALTLIDRVLKFDETNSKALLMRVRVSTASGDLPRALSDAQMLVRDNPQMVDARVALARIFVRRRERILADDSFAEAMKDLSGDSRMLDAYVGYLLETGREKVALDTARQFTAANGRSREGWRIRAELCIRAGDKDCIADAYNALDQIAGGPKVRRRLEAMGASVRPIMARAAKGPAGQSPPACGRTGAPC